MDTLNLILAACAILVALVALLAALRTPPVIQEKRLVGIELEIAELHDLIEAQMVSLKKLHGRANSRRAREPDQVAVPDASADPLDRRPGETGEQWKARIGRMNLSPRRN